MADDNEVMLRTMCELDSRKITSEEELLAIAKLYNVKARIHRSRYPIRKLDKNIYQDIRRLAVRNLMMRGGGSVQQLCAEIELLIETGACGLDKRSFYASRTARRYGM